MTVTVPAEKVHPGTILDFGVRHHLIEEIDAYTHPAYPHAFAICWAEGHHWSYALWHDALVDIEVVSS